MRVNVHFQKKVKGDEEYSSLAYHCSLESEPPPEVAQDRGKLKAYVEELFAECRARVDDQVGERKPVGPAPARPQPPQATGTVPSRRAPGRFASRAAAPSASRREPGDDGHEGLASPKQVNFLRSLGQQSGLSYGQLSGLAEENFGKKDLRDLTKKEASALIDQLRSEAA